MNIGFIHTFVIRRLLALVSHKVWVEKRGMRLRQSERERGTEGDREAETERDRDRQRDIQTETEKERHSLVFILEIKTYLR